MLCDLVNKPPDPAGGRELIEGRGHRAIILPRFSGVHK
jgi:hypothetical protein